MKPNHDSNTHFPYLDTLRVLAILGVIAIHTLDPFGYVYASWSLFTQITMITIASFVQWTVPLYAMISGALVLSAPFVYKKRFLRVGLPLVTWNILFLLKEPLSKDVLLRVVVFGQPLYFLWVIVGLYAITPLLKKYLEVATKKEQIITTAGILLVSMLVSLTEKWLLASQNILPLFSFNYFLYYVGFYLAGFIMHQETKIRIGTKTLVASLITTTISIAGLTTLLIDRFGPTPKGQILFNHLAPTTILQTVVIFLLVKQIQTSATSKIIQDVAKSSFGIYFAHMFILDYIRPFVAPLNGEPLVHSLALFITAFVLSLIGVTIVRKQKTLALLFGL